MLRAIDIAHPWQAGIDPSKVDCDIVIIKVSGGTSYENPCWMGWADKALASGKLIGLYHYACEYDTEPGGRAEADYFWARAKAYKGRFVPILDWEEHATQMPVSYAKAFLDRIKELSGATPFFYGYAANLNTTDYSPIAKYPLWMASYLTRYMYGGWVKDPVNTWPTGNWPKMTMYQYCSTGRIKGWGDNLDLSIFYGDRKDWMDMEDDMSDAYDFLAAKVDPTGRGKKSDMRTRLAYMAQKQEAMQDSIDALSKKLDQLAKKIGA